MDAWHQVEDPLGYGIRGQGVGCIDAAAATERGPFPFIAKDLLAGIEDIQSIRVVIERDVEGVRCGGGGFDAAPHDEISFFFHAEHECGRAVFRFGSREERSI